MHISYLYDVIHEGIILVWIMGGFLVLFCFIVGLVFFFFSKRVLWMSLQIQIFLSRFQQSTCWEQDLCDKYFALHKNVSPPLFPLKIWRIKCLHPTHHNEFWESDGQIMAWHMQPYIDIHTDICLKTQAVGLHRYCFPGISYGGKKNAVMRKDWPWILAEEYSESTTLYRLMRGNRVN